MVASCLQTIPGESGINHIICMQLVRPIHWCSVEHNRSPSSNSPPPVLFVWLLGSIQHFKLKENQFMILSQNGSKTMETTWEISGTIEDWARYKGKMKDRKTDLGAKSVVNRLPNRAITPSHTMNSLVPWHRDMQLSMARRVGLYCLCKVLK